MGDDIEAARKAGVSGVVIGALNPSGGIDENALNYLITKSKGLDITFHRAFDEVRDPYAALEKIIASGCNRILTSGQKATAMEGLQLIKELNQRSNGRIIIMPGSGVTNENAGFILKESGCCEIHASAKEKSNSTWKSSFEEIIKIKKDIQ